MSPPSPPLTLVAVLLVAGFAAAQAGPYGVEIIRAQGPFGEPPYDDPLALLGAPTTNFFDRFGALSGGTTNRRVKLVEPAFNVAPVTNGLLTPNLLLTFGTNSEVILRLDAPATNHPANPYGIDLLVFGNAFYTPNTTVNDSTDMNTLWLAGGDLTEPVRIAVSPGYTGQAGEQPTDPDTWPWYDYAAGPYGDTAFPTHAFEWDAATTNWTDALMNFTKPVNPALQDLLLAGGLTAAQAISLYAGSGGGTGFDLAPSGFGSVEYVRIQGIDPGFSGGEVDAVSVVRPLTVGDTLSIAPQNIASNEASLRWQSPEAPEQTAVRLDFTFIDRVALVTTAVLDDFAAFAPLSGLPVTAVRLGLSSPIEPDPVGCIADLTLTVGADYVGDGADLLLQQSVGTNWSLRPFSYNTATRQLLAPNLTNLSAFVVTRTTAPPLSIVQETNGVAVRFVPMTGWLHLLDRSTNLMSWTPVHSLLATNAEPVTYRDEVAPLQQAFYRLGVRQP